MRKIDLSVLWDFVFLIPFGVFVVLFSSFSLFVEDQIVLYFVCVVYSLFNGFTWVVYHLNRIEKRLRDLKKIKKVRVRDWNEKRERNQRNGFD